MGNAIVQAQPQLTLAEQMQYANTISKGSLVPKAYQGSPANILIAMDFGRSMGLSPAESLYRITVINGKPTASAELIAANVRRAGHKLRVKKDEQARKATVEIVRADDPDYTFSVTWDMAKAQQAQLSGKENWRKYPRPCSPREPSRSAPETHAPRRSSEWSTRARRWRAASAQAPTATRWR